jgi:hypothetical protein
MIRFEGDCFERLCPPKFMTINFVALFAVSPRYEHSRAVAIVEATKLKIIEVGWGGLYWHNVHIKL